MSARLRDALIEMISISEAHVAGIVLHARQSNIENIRQAIDLLSGSEIRARGGIRSGGFHAAKPSHPWLNLQTTRTCSVAVPMRNSSRRSRARSSPSRTTSARMAVQRGAVRRAAQRCRSAYRITLPATMRRSDAFHHTAISARSAMSRKQPRNRSSATRLRMWKMCASHPVRNLRLTQPLRPRSRGMRCAVF
jgi:hypothetical protein